MGGFNGPGLSLPIQIWKGIIRMNHQNMNPLFDAIYHGCWDDNPGPKSKNKKSLDLFFVYHWSVGMDAVLVLGLFFR
jgi:hypothetical protein